MSAAVVTGLTLVIGLAMVAVLVSTKSNTPQVLQGIGSLGSSIIGAAVSPLTGSSQSNNFGSTALNALGNFAGTQFA